MKTDREYAMEKLENEREKSALKEQIIFFRAKLLEYQRIEPLTNDQLVQLATKECTVDLWRAANEELLFRLQTTIELREKEKGKEADTDDAGN